MHLIWRWRLSIIDTFPLLSKCVDILKFPFITERDAGGGQQEGQGAKDYREVEQA